MKTNTETFNTTAQTEPNHQNRLSLEEERNAPIEAPAATQVIREIVAEEEKRYYVRHWGINE